MANNKQHVVATTNEILDTKSGKTLDRIVNKGSGGDDVQKDVIVTIIITQGDTPENYAATVRYSSCNYSASELNTLLEDENARNNVDYYVRMTFDNPNSVATQDNKVFASNPIKLSITSFNPGSSGIVFYFYGPCIDTASGYLQNKQYVITIPWN